MATYVLNTVLAVRNVFKSPVLTKIAIPTCTELYRSNITRSFSTSIKLNNEADGEQEQTGSGKEVLKVVDVDTSIRYLRSKAYYTTYGDEPVWIKYRRNFKGQIPPRKTRKTCIRRGVISTGSPCPICRDEYLVLHPKHIELLFQFVSPDSGQALHHSKTGLCQNQYKKLQTSLEQAWDQGYIDMPLPFRSYDYSEYYPHLKNKTEKD